MDADAALNEAGRARALRAARASALTPSGFGRPLDATMPRGGEADAAASHASEAASQDVFRRRLEVLVRERKIKQTYAELKSGVGAGMMGATTVAQQGTQWLSYVLWGIAIGNIIDTIGLSLLLVFYHWWHYSFKWLKINPFHKYLCRPGADGMLGFIPPPKIPSGLLITAFGLVNGIAAFMIGIVLLFILMLPVLIILFAVVFVGEIYNAVQNLDLGALFRALKALVNF